MGKLDDDEELCGDKLTSQIQQLIENNHYAATQMQANNKEEKVDKTQKHIIIP